jgi:hypothetical protein
LVEPGKQYLPGSVDVHRFCVAVVAPAVVKYPGADSWHTTAPLPLYRPAGQTLLVPFAVPMLGHTNPALQF